MRRFRRARACGIMAARTVDLYPEKKMKSAVRYPLIVAMLAMFAAVAIVQTSVVSAKEEARAARAALTVNTVKPTRDSWPVTIPANGSLAAWQEAVVAAETGGLRITELFVDVGSVVHRGQKLALLAQDLVQADLEQQQARVAQAKAELAEARANADRARGVIGGNTLSEQQINQYLIGQDRAQANLSAAEAQLKNPQIRLEQTNIVAVDDGVISARSATLGSVVQVGTELFRMVRQNRIEWRAEVMADQVANVRSGQKVRLQLSSGEAMLGAVRVAAPTFDVNTRKTLVYVDLPTSKSARPGMFASGEILVGAAATLTLPQAAVVLRDGFSYVFEIGEAQHVVRRKVTTGRRVADRIEIIDGLAEQAVVVASGGAFLNDGDTVRIDEPAANITSTTK